MTGTHCDRLGHLVAVLAAAMLAGATATACADTSTKHNRASSMPVIRPTPSFVRPQSALAPNVVPFRPEQFGTRLRDGASPALRTRLAPGQPYEGAIHDYGPVVNARGHALLLTATYGVYRDDRAPCPSPWEGIIRWASQHATRVWTAKAPPSDAAPTHRGFVIPATACLRRRDLSHKDAADWYVDSLGRIGQLRVTAGNPPAGSRSDAPIDWTSAPVYTNTGGRQRSLLADRDSDRIWLVDNPVGLPGTTPKVPTTVVAQDVTGRRWAIHGDALGTGSGGNYFSWSDDQGSNWASARGDGVPVYTDTTLVFLDTRKVTVSTDRGVNWHQHPIPDLRALAAPRELPRRWQVELLATASGTMLAVAYYSPNFVNYTAKPPVLVRSTDKSWSHFVRVGEMPKSYRWFVKDNTLSACDETNCSYSTNLGATWETVNPPD